MKPLSFDPAAPGEAGRETTRKFCTPNLNLKRSKRSLRILDEARFFTVETPVGPVAAYDWNPGGGDRPIIILCHGWSDSAATWIAFNAPLLEAGYRIVAFDQPAHAATAGLTGVSETIMPRMTMATDAVRAWASGEGTVRALIGHSVGALGAFLAACDADPAPEKLVCIAMPPAVPWFIDNFAAYVGMEKNVHADLWRHLRHRFHEDMGADFNPEDVDSVVRAGDLKIPVLFVQDADDPEVPYSKALEAVEAAKSAGVRVERLDTERLGHQLPLRSPIVLERVLAFLESP